MDFKKEALRYHDNWQEEYQKKVMSPEEAVKIVKSGDLVITPLPSQPSTIIEALAARAPELRDVRVSVGGTAIDPGWFSPEMEASFKIFVELNIGSRIRESMDEKRTSYLPDLFSMRFKGIDDGRPESERMKDFVFFTLVSPPDENGFCSFGHTMWNKRSFLKRARCVVAEINENAIRTYGTNFVHVSEIDYFAKPIEEPDLKDEEWRTIYKIFYKRTPEEVDSKLRLGTPQALRLLIEIGEVMGLKEAGDYVSPLVGLDDPSEAAIGIAKHLKEIIRDGDTIQIGVGRPSSFMVSLGVFDARNDLGIHSEMGCPGMPLLVKRGIANGKYKTLHPGKAVFSTFAGCDADDIEFVADNPAFEQLDSDYVVNINTVSKNNNMVSINNGLQIDLTGQICSETQFGTRMINGQGGQPEMHMGAFLARGGRAITLLPSTALGGISTVVPHLELGSQVTIPRHFADTVITEHGAACLLDKTHQERAEALINIAHPDHRDYLWEKARELFWP
jgi:4-hydroxybutyrate CoA-transferase